LTHQPLQVAMIGVVASKKSPSCHMLKAKQAPGANIRAIVDEFDPGFSHNQIFGVNVIAHDSGTTASIHESDQVIFMASLIGHAFFVWVCD
ncbi:hypothetical protein, partial [Gilvimarinus sp. 1_MG-2023]|uniref:hypothetical protein n=1 Tax=Gilvimarinus sp. 1_MG-2023 TaxID=3062638 RepID=UPI0026E2FB2E